jgi:hypothetical protein
VRRVDRADSEILYRAGVNKTPNRILVTIGFLIMMGIIGSAAGLAWRTHVDLAAFADMQREVNELQAAVQRLELMQQQIGQSVYALQQLQQKNEQTRIVDAHRLSDQLTSLQGEMDKIEKSTVNKEPPKRNSANAAPKNEASNASVGAPR